jgi:hypothetical protein
MLAVHWKVSWNPATLQQHTTGITTATAMAAASGNGPLLPYMRPALHANMWNGWAITPQASGYSFFGGVRVCMALKAPCIPAMMQNWSLAGCLNPVFKVILQLLQ